MLRGAFLSVKSHDKHGQPPILSSHMFNPNSSKVVGNVLESIGNTPIVRLNHVCSDVQAEVYAKLEFMNPGGSVKDRLGYYIIEDAEKNGLIKPGGTIVEGTSGNTGMGLAITAAVKGYKSIFVLPDKMSNEKIRALRAFGAKVVVTPTAVEPEDPRSYYSVSKRLGEETPNSIYIGQYNNLKNRECHYSWTGPEIFHQMPSIDAFVAGIGTGGTICGVARYLREKKPGTQVVAVDPMGSIVYDMYKTGKTKGAKVYKLEGIGEDFLPKNYDFSVIDDMVQVDDKESFLMTRDLLTKEGIYSGVSSGAAVVGAKRWIKAQGEKMRGKKVLVLLPDSGNRYLSKVYDDDWMVEAGFLDRSSRGSVQDLLHFLRLQPGSVMVAKPRDTIASAIEKMKEKGISQLPVRDDQGWIKGVVTEENLLAALYEGKAKSSDPLTNHMVAEIEFVTPEDPVEKVMDLVTHGRIPLVVSERGKDELLGIITKIDLLGYLGSRK